MTTNQMQKTRCQNLKPIWRYYASNSQKSTKNRPKFMDDLKNFLKKFFGFNASKWSNSKSYHVKSEIWRPSKNIPLLGHQSWRLRKFSKFFEKFFLAQTLPNGPIRKVIALKVKFEDLRLHLPLWRHGSRLKIFRPKIFGPKKIFFQSFQMVQFAKLSGQNRNLKTFSVFSPF